MSLTLVLHARRTAWWLLLLLAACVCCIPRGADAQTPSPLQEWQYSGGIILTRLFEPNLPEWRTFLGGATDLEPAYEGARAYRVLDGPVINVQYRDLAFASTGEGFGVNILRGSYYRVGVAVAYDLGRRERDDYANLRGLGDISAAPAIKLFGSYVVSKDFPMVLRIDARQIIGGANGALADVNAYMPMPGSSKKFVLFAGPSVTFATHRYLQNEFGVTPEQSLLSGHPAYDPHSGLEAAGLGFSATKLLSKHWLLNADGAYSALRGSAENSPITERSSRYVLTASADYQW